MTTASSADPNRSGTARAVLQLIAVRLGAPVAVLVGPGGTITCVEGSDPQLPAIADAVVAAALRWSASALPTGVDDSEVADVAGWQVLTVRIAPRPDDRAEMRSAMAFGRLPGSTWTPHDRSSAELAVLVYGLTALDEDDAEPFERQLRGAVDDGALRLHYQGEIDLDTGALVAVEALVRWQHPTLGLLPPEQFIDAAEHSPLIEGLSAWVLEHACAQIATWRVEYPQLSLIVRVNVSPGQLVEDAFVDAVTDVVAKHGLYPGQLCLEITERVVPPDTVSLAAALRRLRERGISTAIDDFGTGYSSLAHLKHLPVDAVKIDRSFISGLGTDAGDTAIVEAVAELAATFGLQVVAEGVETADEAAWLVRIGCHRAQGHLFGAPQPAEDLVELLEAGGVAHQLPFAG